MVPMTSSKQFPICAECQMKEINQPIANPKMRKLFDIPVEFYQESSFLRSIKSQYIRFGSLTSAQKEAFIKVVEEMKNPAMKEQRELKKKKAEGRLSQKELLQQALDKVLAKDSKDKRRKLFETIADLELAGITDIPVQDAVNKLVQKERGRAKLLLMTPEELKAIREGLQ